MIESEIVPETHIKLSGFFLLIVEWATTYNYELSPLSLGGTQSSREIALKAK